MQMDFFNGFLDKFLKTDTMTIMHKKRFFSEHLDILSDTAILGIWAINIMVFALIYALLAQSAGNGQVTS